MTVAGPGAQIEQVEMLAHQFTAARDGAGEGEADPVQDRFLAERHHIGRQITGACVHTNSATYWVSLMSEPVGWAMFFPAQAMFWRVDVGRGCLPSCKLSTIIRRQYLLLR